MFYLANETFEFDLDRFLFDSYSEAFEYLTDYVNLHDKRENDRILDVMQAFNGSETFTEEWTIIEVFDWDRMIFGQCFSIRIHRTRTHSAIIAWDFGEVKHAVEY